jgi:histidyl-tRNA synthetase
VSDGPTKAPEEPRKFRAIRGTRDLLPPETALWNRVEQKAHEVFTTFGFGEIRLPILESVELFARAVGMDTDIVGKEMFVLEVSYENRVATELGRLREDIVSMVVPPDEDLRIQEFKKGMERFSADYRTALEKGLAYRYEYAHIGAQYLDQSISHLGNLLRLRPTFDVSQWPPMLDFAIKNCKMYLNTILLTDTNALRPEATASVCRAYIEHNMQQLPQPVKLYYMGPMFRRERPQKGRYRQFYQIGAEILGGSDAPAIDAELIEMLMTFFGKLDLEGTTLHINSIGHSAPNCRPAYVELLRAELRKIKDKLGPDSQRRIETNPLRVLDSKLEFEQGVIEKLPRIADHLCEDCAKHYAAVKQHLELRGVIYRENWRLVRGLDYYMRTTFEITAQGLGSQNAVCGGGRYDGLVELLGGPPTKGIGFAIGEDRLILSLQEGGKAPAKQGRDVYIAWMGERAYATAVRAAKDLRNAGFSVELPPTELKFGKALGQADKLAARFALILGDNEVSEGLWTLKTLADGTQTKLPEPALIEHLRKSLSPLAGGL